MSKGALSTESESHTPDLNGPQVSSPLFASGKTS